MKKYYFDAGEFAYVILAKSLYEAISKLERNLDTGQAKTRETQNSGILGKVLSLFRRDKGNKTELPTFKLVEVKKCNS